MPSLLSLCLHFLTFNILLFLFFYVPYISPYFTLQSSVFSFFECFVKLCSNIDYWNQLSHLCAFYNRYRGRQTGDRLHPHPLLLQSTRHCTLAWLHPSEQLPGLSLTNQIDSVWVSTLMATTNIIHPLISNLHWWKGTERHLHMCINKHMRDKITSYPMKHCEWD